MTIVELLISNRIAKNEFQAQHIVENLKLLELETESEQLARAKLYREWRNAGENRNAAVGRTLAGEKAPDRLIDLADHG